MRRFLLSTCVLVLVALTLGLTYMPLRLRPAVLRSAELMNWKHPLNRGLVAWWLVLPKRTGGVLLRNLVAQRSPCTLTNMANSPSATKWLGTHDQAGRLWGDAV